MTTALSDPIITTAGRQYLRLQMSDDVGPIRLRSLVDHFGSVDAVLGASQAELQRVDGIGPKIAESILRCRSDNRVAEEINRATACDIRIVCLADDDYPRPLLNIPDPPGCLYLRGRLQPTDGVAMAIVGTRRCSHYGREQAVRFAELLAGVGFTVVSGLARGIDGHAHRGAIRAGGRTLAVLGNGLAKVYPPDHESLASEIVRAGALISELPIDSSPDAKNFPPRNRIIAGLALGVIVIEAGKKSGALITARMASEYNREVFALPGQVDRPDQTGGSNGLIRDGGAKLITCLEDVLDELADVGEIMRRGVASPSEGFGVDDGAVRIAALSGHERAIYDAVLNGADDVDLVTSATQLEAARVTATLTALELKGAVQRLPGPRFVPRRGSHERS